MYNGPMDISEPKPIRQRINGASFQRVCDVVGEAFSIDARARAHKSLWRSNNDRFEAVVEAVCSALGVVPEWG